MKRILAIMLALMLAMSMVFVASAEEEKPLIGILAPATTHGWVGGVTYYAQAKADELELNYKLLTSSDADEMSSQIDQLIGLGAKAIVVWPQFTGVEMAAERALEAGIIIYNFDMKIDVDEKYADLMYVLTGDNYGMGVEGAKYIAEKLEGEGKVLVMNKPAAGNVNDDRCAGFYDTIAEVAPDIEILPEVASDFTRDRGLADMSDALTANEQIDAVFSLDDETSIGALQAILESERTDVKAITGGGGCQEYFNMMLADEYQNIWVASATYSPSMIATCIENVVKVLEGEEIEHEIVDPSVIVDRENAESFLDADTPY